MADSAHANWIAMWEVYGGGDLIVPVEGCEHTCLFH